MESDDSSSNESFKSNDEQIERRKSHSMQSNAPTDECRLVGDNKNDSLDMSHQDLSDVSDLESGHSSEAKFKNDTHDVKDLRQMLDKNKASLENSNGFTTKERKADEEVLDFEAEEGECNDEKDETSQNKVSSLNK